MDGNTRALAQFSPCLRTPSKRGTVHTTAQLHAVATAVAPRSACFYSAVLSSTCCIQHAMHSELQRPMETAGLAAAASATSAAGLARQRCQRCPTAAWLPLLSWHQHALLPPLASPPKPQHHLRVSTLSTWSWISFSVISSRSDTCSSTARPCSGEALQLRGRQNQPTGRCSPICFLGKATFAATKPANPHSPHCTMQKDARWLHL
jgi:hypothetical protein